MLALLLIAGCVGCAWGAAFLVRGSMVLGGLLFLLTVCCFGHQFAHFDAGPLPLTLDRLMLGLIFATYVIQRKLGRLDPKPLTRADGLLIAFVALLAVSMFSTDWRHATINTDSTPMFRLVAAYLIPLGLFWIARDTRLTARHLSLVYGSLTVFGVYLSITALLEITRQWSLVFPQYIADPKLGLHFGRARGPMVHSVSFGLYLATCLIAAWEWRKFLGRPGQLLLWLSVPLFLAGLFFSYTRSVWMGTAASLMICVGLRFAPRWRVVCVAAMLLVGVLLSTVKLDELVAFEREGSASETRESVNMRGCFAYVSWKMFLDRPVAGFGFGQFPKGKLPYLSDRTTDLRLESIRTYVHHNTFLSLLTETGVIGLGMFLAVLGSWGWTGWRLWRSRTAPEWARGQGLLLLGVLAILSIQMMFHDLTYSPLDHSLLFFMAGLTCGLRRFIEAPATSRHTVQPRLSFSRDSKRSAPPARRG